MTPTPPPKLALFTTLAISGAVALSAAGVAVAALLQPRANWVMFGFETSVLVAGVLGVMIARGRIREGVTLGIACVAGTVLIGSAFAYLGGGRALFQHDIRLLVFIRAIAALALGATAAWIVLARAPRQTVPAFIRGCVLALPIPILGAALWFFRDAVAKLSDVAQIGLALFAFALLTGFLAASTQYLIRAFNIGLRQADGEATT